MSSPSTKIARSRTLWTPAFAIITLSGFAYFTALGALMPVLPRYVKDGLGGGGFAVGVAVGAFSVSAALLRPAVGRLGDLRGRRLLVVAGGLVVALSIAGYAVAHNLAVLVVLRLLTGAGEAAFFVGAATSVQDLAPPERRGEAASYFSLSLYGGLAVGPPLGEVLVHHLGWTETWLVVAALAMAAPLFGRWVPVGTVGGTERRSPRLLHPAAVGPGVVLVLGMMGFAAFGTFVPTWTDHLRMDGSGGVFGVYAATILGVRLLGARIPDRLGPYVTAAGSLVALVAGLVVMAVWAAATGLFVGTVVFSFGMSLLFPGLFLQVMRDAPDEERSHAVGTFSLFFDLSQGIGAPVLGVLVSLADERAAFVAAALLCAAGLALLRARRSRFSSGPAPAVGPDGGEMHVIAELAEPH